jgi:hypothetical protein
MRILAVIVFVIAFNGMEAQTITGKVFIRNDERLPLAIVSLSDTSNSHIIIGTVTDIDGIYKIDTIYFGYCKLHIKYLGVGDTAITLNITRDTIINIKLDGPCEYDKSIHDSTCPVCHKTDEVIPIVYGYNVNPNGKDTTFNADGHTVSYCQPHWYCKKDKVKF